METVRDRLWIWGHEAGSHNGRWNLPGISRMTPAEGAYFLGVPNLVMVCFGNLPEPPFETRMRALSPLRRVVWSVLGDSSSSRDDLPEVLSLSERYPNLVGGIMDDFFHEPGAEGRISRYSVAELQRLRARLRRGTRPLDLWVVLYAHQLALPVQPYLAECDVVTFWTWKAQDLRSLEGSLSRARALAGEKPLVLGCYMWDYGVGQPMPRELMQQQCEFGLSALRAGRIAGMIFLASCIADLGLESVEWARQWVSAVGDQPLL
jgi:hypothetical protein